MHHLNVSLDDLYNGTSLSLSCNVLCSKYKGNGSKSGVSMKCPVLEVQCSMRARTRAMCARAQLALSSGVVGEMKRSNPDLFNSVYVDSNFLFIVSNDGFQLWMYIVDKKANIFGVYFSATNSAEFMSKMQDDFSVVKEFLMWRSCGDKKFKQMKWQWIYGLPYQVKAEDSGLIILRMLVCKLKKIPLPDCSIQIDGDKFLVAYNLIFDSTIEVLVELPAV